MRRSQLRMHSSCTQHHILFVYVFFLKWLIDIVNFYLFLQSINFQNFLVLVGLWTTNPQFFPYLTMNRVKLIGMPPWSGPTINWTFTKQLKNLICWHYFQSKVLKKIKIGKGSNICKIQTFLRQFLQPPSNSHNHFHNRPVKKNKWNLLNSFIDLPMEHMPLNHLANFLNW